MALNQPEAGPIDLDPGEADAPTFSLGGPDDYAIAPDGGELCFVRKTVDRPELSTDTNLFVVPMTGEPVKLTSNPAADLSPAYSPDGRYPPTAGKIRAGYESDRWRLIVLSRTRHRQRAAQHDAITFVTSAASALRLASVLLHDRRSRTPAGLHRAPRRLESTHGHLR
ncbi:MAG: hypothetical protein R2724_05460 [Bryobacterales bacterium]